MKVKLSTGSVMMEFLLVMPIYFVLFGGTFWIGELFIHRQKLLQLDRNATFHAGIRHDRGSMSMAILNRFYFDTDKDPGFDISKMTEWKQMRALKADQDRYPWLMVVGGKASLKTPLPPWTKGWLNVETLWKSMILKATQIKVETTPLTSNNEMTYNFLSAALMRTKGGEGGYRSWHPRQLCDESSVPVTSAVWHQKVYNADDPYKTLQQFRSTLSSLENDTAKPTAPSRRDYERYEMYWTWSQNPLF